MHEPDTWVVGLEADDGVAWWGAPASGASEHGGITSSRIVEVEGVDKRWVPGGVALAENRHVVTVQMHGMASEELVLDDEVHPLVLYVQGDVVTGSGVAKGAGSKGLKSGLGEVDVHGTVVDEPSEDNAIIRGGDIRDGTSWEGRDGLLECRLRSSTLLEIWAEAGKRLVSANGEVSGGLASSGGGWESSISTFIKEDTVGISKTVVGTARWATSLSNSSEEVTRSLLVHLHNDIVSLTDTNVEPLSLVWGDGNVVSCNDGHLVAVKVNGEHVLRSRVDKTEEILLARLDLPESVLALAEIWEGVGTVEQVVPCS